jgi:spermidine synthase
VVNLFGRNLAGKYASETHGEIVVKQAWGRKTLVAGGVNQSGGEYERMWKRVVERFADRDFKSGLVLGVGGGTVMTYLQEFFPRLRIVGVEIDPVMVTVARNHFGLEWGRRVQIEVTDAFAWVRQNLGRKQYEMVVVDLFVGRLNSPGVEKPVFLKQLKELLKPGGVVVFNRHFRRDRIDEWENFEQACLGVFDKTEVLFEYPFNRVVVLS